MAELLSQGDIAVLPTSVNQNIAEIRAEFDGLRNDLKEMRARLEAKIERLKFDLLKWLILLMLVQAAFIVTLLKLLK